MNNIVREVVHRLGSFYLHLVCIVFKKAVDGRFVVFQGFAFLLLIGHRLRKGSFYYELLRFFIMLSMNSAYPSFSSTRVGLSSGSSAVPSFCNFLLLGLTEDDGALLVGPSDPKFIIGGLRLISGDTSSAES